MNHKHLTSAVLALLICLTGCEQTSERENDPKESKETETTTISTETLNEYDYPDKGFDGYEFVILNMDSYYNSYVKVDVGEQTGETVDDAVWARNRKVEDKLGITITERTENFGSWDELNKTGKLLRQDVMAGDETYDCGYVSVAAIPGIITEGYLYDLNSIKTLNLDKEWWDNDLNKQLELNGKLFCATSPLQLTALDLTWVLLFNKSILAGNQLELPYDIVREGKWTFEKMNEYVSKVANLNGDESFAFNETGKAVYGIAAHNSSRYFMLTAGDNALITTDQSGTPRFTGGNERLYNTVEKAAALLSTSDGKCIFGDNDLAPGSYYYIFVNNRSAFLTSEIKGTHVMRPYDIEFGIVPMPKYDEAQECYIAYASQSAYRLCVPSNASDPERTGSILDALSFESKYNVLPLYYDQTICQKGLRDEESIEMLSLVSDGRRLDMGMVFGFTSSLMNGLKQCVLDGGQNAASVVAENSAQVEVKLTELLDKIA